jgi:glycosyltransferase involved in cell wall biosynthesis
MRSMRKTILVLTSTFPRWKGDVEPPFVYELSRRLLQHYRVHVLAPHAPGAAVEEVLDGIRVTRYRYFFTAWQNLAYHGGILANLKQNPWRFFLIPFFVFAQLSALIRMLYSRSFDLIHAHWLIPQGLVALMGRYLVKSAPPLLCTSHGGDLFGLKGSLFNWLKRQVAAHSTAVTVVSRTMRDTLSELGIDQNRIQVIPMGVDLQTKFVPPQNRPDNGSILFVGRLVEKKGLNYLIEGLPSILEKHPTAMLRIAGDGQDRAALEKLSSGLGLEAHVQFLGALDNELLPALYQTADVVAFPSVVAADGDREGFGLVLVEALGCECATVVSDLPAMQDIVIDGKTGLVVPQKNSGRLAEKIIQLLDDAGLRKSLAKAGRQHVVGRYDWGIITRKYQELIETITI